MKNLYSKNEFLELYNRESATNEGLLTFMGNMFKKISTYVKKIKGGNEIERIYKKYLDIINDEFSKQAQINLNLTADEQLANQQKQQDNQQKKDSKLQTVEKVKLTFKNALYEDADADAEIEIAKNQKVDSTANLKLDAKKLVSKLAIIEKILKLAKEKAKSEMNNVLTKMGGREKNPKLSIMIDNKIYEFDLAVLNAEIDALNKSGDNVNAQKLAVKRDKIAKTLNDSWSKIDKVESAEITVKINGNERKLKVGGYYRYKKDDGNISSIKIIDISKDNPDFIIGTYRNPGNNPDNKTFKFSVNKIDIEFEPKIGKTYKYFSVSAKQVIEVEVKNLIQNSDMIKAIGKGSDKEIDVLIGALEDEVK